LLLSAKDLFVAANGGKLSLPDADGTTSALNSAQDLASIPTAGGAFPASLSRPSKRWRPSDASS
jgi:hypothetical protein